MIIPSIMVILMITRNNNHYRLSLSIYHDCLSIMIIVRHSRKRSFLNKERPAGPALTALTSRTRGISTSVLAPETPGPDGACHIVDPISTVDAWCNENACQNKHGRMTEWLGWLVDNSLFSKPQFASRICCVCGNVYCSGGNDRKRNHRCMMIWDEKGLQQLLGIFFGFFGALRWTQDELHLHL